jgi:hypothetical protein
VQVREHPPTPPQLPRLHELRRSGQVQPLSLVPVAHHSVVADRDRMQICRSRNRKTWFRISRCPLYSLYVPYRSLPIYRFPSVPGVSKLRCVSCTVLPSIPSESCNKKEERRVPKASNTSLVQKNATKQNKTNTKSQCQKSQASVP